MKKLLLLALLILVLGISACDRDKDKSARLAEVNGESLSLEAFKASFGVEDWDTLPPDLRKRYVEDWVNLTLLAQECKNLKLDKELALKQRLDYAQKKVLANALISQSLSEIKITEDQLFSYFRIHQSDFQKPVKLYHIERIRLGDKISAENLLQQLSGGMNFYHALQQYSQENLRAQRGSIGFVEPASADSLFWQKAQALQLNECGIVNKDGDWYIFRYTEVKDGESVANFEEQRSEIRRRIILEKQEEVYQNLLKSIKARQQNIYYY